MNCNSSSHVTTIRIGILSSSHFLFCLLSLLLVVSKNDVNANGVVPIITVEASSGRSTIRGDGEPITYINITSLGSGRDFYDYDNIIMQLEANGPIYSFRKKLGSSVTNAHFVSENRNYSLNLLRWTSDASSRSDLKEKAEVLVGTVVDFQQEAAYVLGADAAGNAFITKSLLRNHPPVLELLYDDHSIVFNPHNHRDLEEEDERQQFLRKQSLLYNDGSSSSNSTSNAQSRHLQSLNRRLQGTVVNTVMVLWTRAAECQTSSLPSDCTVTNTTYMNMEAKIALGVEETNVALSESEVDVRIELVHSYREEVYEEPYANDALALEKALNAMIRREIESVAPLRDLYEADLVVLIGHSDIRFICGIAAAPASDGIPLKNFAFSATKWSCIGDGSYTFGHEIGHNWGCRHDRGTRNECTSPATWYGYRNQPAGIRDIMAYACETGQCDNLPNNSTCSPVQRFSFQGDFVTDVDGTTTNVGPVGDANNDCASQISFAAPIVADFYGSSMPSMMPSLSSAPSSAPSLSSVPSSMPSSPTPLPTMAPTRRIKPGIPGVSVKPPKPTVYEKPPLPTN